MSDIIDLGSIQDALGFTWRWPWQKRRRPAQKPMMRKQQLHGSLPAHLARAGALLKQIGPYEAYIKQHGLPCGKEGLEIFYKLSKIYGGLLAEVQNLSGGPAQVVNRKLAVLYNDMIRPLAMRLFGCCSARAPGA